MFNVKELLEKSRIVIKTGTVISENKVRLYNGSVVRINSLVGRKDVGKSVKLIKDPTGYSLLDFSRKRNTKSKTFIV